MHKEVVRLLAFVSRRHVRHTMDELKKLRSAAYYEILEVVEELRAEGFAVANRGLKGARTRLRTKLSALSKLCAQARKEIPPVSRERDWPCQTE